MIFFVIINIPEKIFFIRKIYKICKELESKPIPYIIILINNITTPTTTPLINE